MKIHNTAELDINPDTLRALARGDLDPVRLAMEESLKTRYPATQQEGAREGEARDSSKQLAPAGEKGVKKAEADNAAPPVPREATDEGERSSKKRGRRRMPKENIGETQGRNSLETEAERSTLLRQQKMLVQIIRECEALEVLNYELLAMKRYPNIAILETAKRRRDLWLMGLVLTFGMGAIGFFGYLPAWLSGISFGMFFALLSFAIPAVRDFFMHGNDYATLRNRQKEMEFQAMAHIKMLEGSNGLAYQCQMMAPYRKALGDRQFSRLVTLSRHKALLKAIRSVSGIRLYLLYLLEAQQAFEEVKKRYMETSSRLKEVSIAERQTT